MSLTPGFWEKPLKDLNKAEWEALCDGCGRCCLKKLINTNDETVHYTRVVCRYFTESNCSCSVYQRRQELVPDCLVMDYEMLEQLDWIPSSCAYKLRYENKPLPSWHPLLTGSRIAMDADDMTIAGKVISEQYVHEQGLEEHIIRWVSP